MEERILKVIFNKSGSGSITPKLNIPMSWIKNMGVSIENREIVAIYNEETQEIIIKKTK